MKSKETVMEVEAKDEELGKKLEARREEQGKEEGSDER